MKSVELKITLDFIGDVSEDQLQEINKNVMYALKDAADNGLGIAPDEGEAITHIIQVENETNKEKLVEVLFKPKFRVKDIESGEIYHWDLDDILEEINRDRSSQWTDYDESDWREGWKEWVEGQYLTLLD